MGWESGQQKRASHNLPELKESLQLKWHDMDGRWPTGKDIEDFQSFSEVGVSRFLELVPASLLLGRTTKAREAVRYICWHRTV